MLEKFVGIKGIGYSTNIIKNKLKIESAYDKVIKQRGIQWNITMGLYWIRPNTYINLDSKNREFIITDFMP